MKNGQAMMEPNEAVAMIDSSPELHNDAHPMALLLEEIEQSLFAPRIGDIRNGTIVEKRSNELLIDIGFKSEGFVNGREIDRIKEDLDSLNIGDEVPVYILREDKDGNMMLSISRAQAEQDWLRAQELLDNQEMFDGEVTAHNRGGVIIKLGQVRGFVPASQLSTSENPNQSSNNANGDELDESNRYAHLIGLSLKLKVIDLDRKRNHLILSERLAMREWRRKQKEELLESLKEGDIYEGTISSIADFGAFVDLGGADGLIHLSELSWNRISHPNEVVSVGSKVKVQIMAIDLERRRIGLSLRRLQPQPWELVDQTYEVGQVVHGRITKIVNFGAFARLEQDGIEGLIHISELSEERVNHPKEVVSEGQEHDLRIIRIDIDKRRMGLSLKQALPPKEVVELDWQIAPSDTVGVTNENGQREVAAQVANALSESAEPDSTADELIESGSESENGVYGTDVAVEEVAIES
ncbi:S1 RNA-binding domain-containing protein [Chloroflexi bacterium TSY]|nr:S1 RNA-binding domain-containing protein [Chloroflexi bacterium TSY]